MSPYAALNPFTVTSVGENDLWNAVAFLDVPYINSVPFGALKIAVDQVRAQRRSQVRFVRGAGGAGKSHLFARLHRESGAGIFYAYAPNPPLQPEALEQFILSRFVSSLRHPARAAEGKLAPYSQLRLLAYALLKPVVEQEFTFPELHEAWATIALETRKEMIHQAVQLLEAEHPMVPRSVLRCLLNILRDDKEHLAAQWLSGAAYLTENELKYLGVPEPLQRGEMGVVIQLFGKLAAQAGSPVVLVLDQLDLIVSQPQFDEMQRLLFSLIDQSENWVVLIGLVVERFAMWDMALSQALRGRIGVPDTNAPQGFRLPVIDMLPIANEQKRLLLSCRLEAPDLVAQRKKDGITSAIHPLQDEDIALLTSGGAIFPRHLLAAAAEIYTMRATGAPPVHLPQEVVVLAGTPAVNGTTPPSPSAPARVTAPPAPVAPPVARVPPPAVSRPVAQVKPPVPETAPVAVCVVEETKAKADEPVAAAIPVAAIVAASSTPAIPNVIKVPLAEKIDTLLQEAIGAARSETAAASAIDLGERARDLIELMVAPPVTATEGDMRKTYDNFDGSDRWFEWGGGKVRIVTSDAMRGSLIAVLERIKEAAGDTLLLRHAVAPVSGQLTLELLNAFKAKNIFHHVPASETAVLAALGRVLAAQREGSYDQLPTEPPATKDNVLAALRNHSLLRGLHLWGMIQKAHAPKEPATPAPPKPSVLSTIARPPSVAVVKPPPVPGAKPPAPAVSPSVIPGAARPPMPVARPPAIPGAKGPPPPTVVAKPVAKPPATPAVRLPTGAATRPPAAKLPPPSQGTAA